MAVVLGIDAAWTSKNPSGIALAKRVDRQWMLVTASPSVPDFIDGRGPVELSRAASDILNRADALAGSQVSVVAVDMPLSQSPITGRRASDSAVSRAYGGRKCSTHSPSSSRPGKVSSDMQAGFVAAGYPLTTHGQHSRALIEVYPHPALVELASAPERLPYKVGKLRTYWKALSPEDRKLSLLKEWGRIATLLDTEIAGVTRLLPAPSPNTPLASLKAYEDMLDAVVCAWVGICFLEGRAIPFGDEVSAIWIPRPALGVTVP